ncbi:hypothetical protein JVU11DRAFT_10576 [Chiua virens]|nr:hypothetical protein JVU11DRAFT_10576 [Chiua virens]
MRLPHHINGGECVRSDSDVKLVSDELAGNGIRSAFISRICVMSIFGKLRRIPVGFCVVVKSEVGTQRTVNKPALVGIDVVEWVDEIALPSDISSKISLTVFALFELGPTLGAGEALRELEITVGELLRNNEFEAVRLWKHDDGDVEVKVQQIAGRRKHLVVSDIAVSDETWRLQELTDMGHQALTRYREQQERGIDECIRHFERARDLCPLGHPSRATVLFNLANAKMMHCRMNGISPDLDAPVNLYRTALSLRSRDHPDYPFTLLSLGVALKARFQRQANTADEVEGDTLLSQILAVSQPDNYAYHTAVLALNGTANTECLSQMETVEHDDDMTSHLDVTLQQTLCADSSRPALLDPLGILFCVRLDWVGHLVDCEKAIPMLEVVVQYTSDDHPDKPSRLGNLAYSLSLRYERFGDIMDLEKSISTGENAVQLTLDGHPDKLTWLGNLASSISSRYERFGDLVDLDKSLSIREDIVLLTSDGHADKPIWLGNLAYSLASRYDRFGDIVDLEKSISLRGNAVQLTPDNHPDKPIWLGNLACSLSRRYERFWDVTDLEQSLSHREDAVRLTPDEHPDKPARLGNLACSLSHRYERFSDVVDLDRSISAGEEALRLTPDSHPDKLIWLGNLASLLSTRYESFGGFDDLEKSISLGEEAVWLTPDGHPDRPLRLNNLSDLLLCRYECSGNVVDLEMSISMGDNAVQLAPDGHPDRPIRLNNLAHLLFRRSQHSRESSSTDSDLHRAILYSSQATCSNAAPAHLRFRGSQLRIQCLRLLPHDPQSLLDACTASVGLLPQLVMIGLDFQDRYRGLLQAADAICEAAASAIELHRYDLAVEWLEQGRTIMWSQVSQLRIPVDDLRSSHPVLATQFERVSLELEHASAPDSNSNTTGRSFEKQAHQRHALAFARETLLAKIRALPGFERFLFPKTIDQLSSLVHAGHVVFLNASKQRCDALIVMATKQVIHVPLSHTNYDEIASMQRQLKTLLRSNDRVIPHDDSDIGRTGRPVRLGPNDVFRSSLSRLWNKVVGPILNVLGLSTPPDKHTRIFWCPTGAFTFLPIHAAGIYDTAIPTRGSRLSDFAISSYIPTMSALEQLSQQGAMPPSSKVRLLAVPQPSSDGQNHLHGVKEEIEVMKELTSSSPSVDLEEADGTVEDVLSKMKESDWVHFCCHGTQDLTNPLDSGLLLAHCRRLKLSDILQLSRPRGGLAFLSACQTATGDEHLSDEVIHLAAGMLLAGYSGVIATMWSIMDRDAPRVAKDVYERLIRDGKVADGGLAAEALHHAIEQLRDSGSPFLSWVPFVHYGF